MLAIPLRGHIEADGTLKLHVPTGLPRSVVDVVVVVQPVDAERQPAEAVSNDWSGYVNGLYGSAAGAPLERPPQGNFEVRESMD